MKFLAFDIETAGKAPERGSADSWKTGITCAATWDGKRSQVFKPHLLGTGKYADRMTAEQCRAFARSLMNAHHQDGYTICSVNGGGFDFRVLAAECETLLWTDNLTDLALAHFDPGFQMLAVRGFMVGLAAMAKGFGFEGKTEGMDGLQAIDLWSGSRSDQNRVLEYVEQDARATFRICTAIQQDKGIRWVTQKQIHSRQQIDVPHTVRECLRLPVPRTSWMDNPFSREEVLSWMTVRAIA